MTRALLTFTAVLAAPLAKAESDLTVSPGPPHGGHVLHLPDQPPGTDLQRLEGASRLGEWTTLARRYPQVDWHSTPPIEGHLQTTGPNAQFQDPIGGQTRFYRIVSSEPPPYTAAEQVSAFLRQSTFGPRMEDITSFMEHFGTPSGDNPNEPFTAWVDDQMTLPPFLHRAFFRRQSDPNYEDQSALVDSGRNHHGEVGHDEALGHRLNCYRGNVIYRPDSSCPFPGHGGADGLHMRQAALMRPTLTASQQSSDLNFNVNLTKQLIWFEAAFNAPDQLRQRMAWALSQHFVVGEEGSNLDGLTERWTSYYDIFVRHAFGNFRDILSEVTWHPHMGYYLSHLNNRKANPAQGTFPDENYAREVMQLFTIGLWELQPNGQLLLDREGEAIPTYDNDDITEFAKIFTGFVRAPERSNIEINGGNWVDPMRINASRHDFSTKVLLDGSLHGPFPSTVNGAVADVEGFLDHLFAHPNLPPFFAAFLIQRFTVSNPSPLYVESVANAFATGQFEGQGTGQRGDLAATLKAVLLHPEARAAALSRDPVHGKLREPLLRLIHFSRSMRLQSTQTHGLFPFQNLDDLLGQGPYQSPSVFNFFRPDYQPNGLIADKGLAAPEFETNDDVTGLNLPNALHNLAHNGLRGGAANASITPRAFPQGELDMTEAASHAGDAAALIAYLDLLLCSGRLTDGNRAVLLDEIAAMPVSSQNDRLARVRRALSLFALLPEFNTLY
ncbi:MAG: hypothetical protein RL648_35 [Verrucomicrobiota bacterium]